jgi:hypothetical protein
VKPYAAASTSARTTGRASSTITAQPPSGSTEACRMGPELVHALWERFGIVVSEV